MSDISPGRTPAPPEDRLDSWKEIAAYLKRDVTTVQRWEKREGMPVHRHVHDKLGSVYAFRAELDAWTRGRNLPLSAEQADIERTPEVSERPAAVVASERVAGPATAGPRRVLRVWVWAAASSLVILAIAGAWWRLETTDFFWRSPLADARFQTLTDFGGAEQAAAISRDGKFVAFLSDRDGQMDVWVTQVGTGRFYNLTRGRIGHLVNTSVRTLGFSPDNELVTFWTRRGAEPNGGGIGIAAAPMLGGESGPYLEGVAEFDWSHDGSRLVYHTPGPGDPMFVRAADDRTEGKAIFTAAAGLHAHFPIWSPNAAFIYFAQGVPDEAMDVWRIRSAGGPPERITHQNTRVSHPVLLDDRTLLYLAADPDGSGPWLYSVDVERRIPHRLSTGPQPYTSLSVSADGRRIVATLASPHGTIWRLPVADTPADGSLVTPVSLPTGRAAAPRVGPGYLLYVASKGSSDGIWKLADGVPTELWSAPDARVIGGPEIAPDGRRIAFSVEQRGKTLLYTLSADGSGARVVTDGLALRGAPAWAPDGASITAAVSVNGAPRLFRISLDGAAAAMVREYSLDPVWSPSGSFLVYTGADVGTTFPVKAVTADGAEHAIPNLTLTRGARRIRFLNGGRALAFLRGDMQHKEIWSLDLVSGAERQLTRLPAGFEVRDFDVSSDGRELVLERLENRSDIVLIDRPPGR
jgi:Tol biopolymer transport system component